MALSWAGFKPVSLAKTPSHEGTLRLRSIDLVLLCHDDGDHWNELNAVLYLEFTRQNFKNSEENVLRLLQPDLPNLSISNRITEMTAYRSEPC